MNNRMRQAAAVLFAVLLLVSCGGRPPYDFGTPPSGEDYTEGLLYEPLFDGSGYILAGLGTATDAELLIPSTYQGLPVVEIGEGAFSGHTPITELSIPKTVETIREGALSGCYGLRRISVEEGNPRYRVMGNCLIDGTDHRLIRGCDNSWIPADGSVEGIGDYAFSGCDGLTAVTLPETVKAVGRGAFEGCSSLKRILLPEGVTFLGDGAFSGCTELESVRIPKSLQTIGAYAFLGCAKLESIVVAEGNPSYCGEGNCLIEVASGVLIRGCANSQIPADGRVRIIGEAAFSGCVSLTSIALPDHVTEIRSAAFEGCVAMTEITLPKGITTVGDHAFARCAGLIEIELNEGLITLGDAALLGCVRLREIYLPSTLRQIGDNAFFRCTGLGRIILPRGLETVGSEVLEGCTILTEAIFTGSAAEWQTVKTGDRNETLLRVLNYENNTEG